MNEKPVSYSKWHKSLELATVTGIAMGGLLFVLLELLDSSDVQKAGVWEESILWNEDGRSKSKRHRSVWGVVRMVSIYWGSRVASMSCGQNKSCG